MCQTMGTGQRQTRHETDVGSQFHAGRKHLPIVKLNRAAEQRGVHEAATLPALTGQAASGVSVNLSEPLCGCRGHSAPRGHELVLSAIDSNPYGGDRRPFASAINSRSTTTPICNDFSSNDAKVTGRIGQGVRLWWGIARWQSRCHTEPSLPLAIATLPASSDSDEVLQFGLTRHCHATASQRGSQLLLPGCHASLDQDRTCHQKFPEPRPSMSSAFRRVSSISISSTGLARKSFFVNRVTALMA